MRFIGLFVAFAACSGRAPDAGPTISEPALGTSAGARPGDPARPPGRPLDGAALDALAAVTVAGHDVTVARRSATDLAAIVTAPGGARVTVTASGCLGCAAMEVAAWEARRPELAALWAPLASGESGGDALVLAASSVGGRTVIAIDARRTQDSEVRRTYQLHWNDGVAQLAAICETLAPADDCPGASATVLAAYLQALPH